MAGCVSGGMGEEVMKILGLEFGLGQISGTNMTPITTICITDGFDELRVPLFLFGVLAFAVALGTKIVLYGV